MSLERRYIEQMMTEPKVSICSPFSLTAHYVKFLQKIKKIPFGIFLSCGKGMCFYKTFI